VGLPQEFVDLAREVSNWGRWGDDDELGTLNLITHDVVKRAADCVRTGKTFALGLPLSADGPQTGAVPGRTNPEHRMSFVNFPYGESGVAASDDSVSMGLQAGTHWDALTHISFDGHIYNGYEASVITESGAAKCGIEKVRKLVSRGVLIDVARDKGIDRLEPGYTITPDDLDSASKTDVLPGDVVLIRTGQMQLLDAGDKEAYGMPSPGPGMACARWFNAHDVAAVATDTYAFEVLPGEIKGLFLPVHVLDLVQMGMLQGQNFVLEELARDCAEDSVYEFLLEATPEPFVGAVGAPVQPVAIK
jgi:kynurenine formamidase